MHEQVHEQTVFLPQCLALMHELCGSVNNKRCVVTSGMKGVRPHRTEPWTRHFLSCRRLLLGNQWPTPSIWAGVKRDCFSSPLFFSLHSLAGHLLLMYSFLWAATRLSVGQDTLKREEMGVFSEVKRSLLWSSYGTMAVGWCYVEAQTKREKTAEIILGFFNQASYCSLS